MRGTARNDQSGRNSYFLKIPVVAYAKWGMTPIARPDTIKQFNLVVDGSGATFQIDAGLPALKVYPNPASGQFFIYHNRGAAVHNPRFFDAAGREVFVKTEQIQGGFKADGQALMPGFYFVTSDQWNCILQIRP